MTQNTKKPKGGRRPGAGRPRVDSKPVNLRLRLETIAWIDAQEGRRSQVVEKLIEERRTVMNSIYKNRTIPYPVADRIIESIKKATTLDRLNAACQGIVEFRTPNHAESFNLHDPDDLRPIRYVLDRGEYQANAAFRSLGEAKECALASVLEHQREQS